MKSGISARELISTLKKSQAGNELANPFLFCSFVCFCLYGPFNCISFHKLSQELRFLTPLFRSHFCLFGPLNYISLYESLLQPRCNPLWLTGLRALTNFLTALNPSTFTKAEGYLWKATCMLHPPPPSEYLSSWNSMSSIYHVHLCIFRKS